MSGRLQFECEQQGMVVHIVRDLRRGQESRPDENVLEALGLPFEIVRLLLGGDYKWMNDINGCTRSGTKEKRTAAV